MGVLAPKSHAAPLSRVVAAQASKYHTLKVEMSTNLEYCCYNYLPYKFVLSQHGCKQANTLFLITIYMFSNELKLYMEKQ